MNDHTDPARILQLSTTPETYFRDGHFQRDLEAYTEIPTGYADLDRVRPLTPGLYCLGERTGTDATDFCSQMADQVAASGQPVLYFSLRDSTSGLYSRSATRGSCPEKDRFTVIHGDGPMTVEDITGTIDGFVGRSGTRPLVVIDCLPLVAPSPICGTDPETCAGHVARSLKATQIRNNLAMILVLPLEGHRLDPVSPVSPDSFEGHGGLEYLADVLWALQPSETPAKDALDAARHVELVCAKDRFYAPDYKVAFLYHADRCFFQPAPDPKDPKT